MVETSAVCCWFIPNRHALNITKYKLDKTAETRKVTWRESPGFILSEVVVQHPFQSWDKKNRLVHTLWSPSAPSETWTLYCIHTLKRMRKLPSDTVTWRWCNTHGPVGEAGRRSDCRWNIYSHLWGYGCRFHLTHTAFVSNLISSSTQAVVSALNQTLIFI